MKFTKMQGCGNDYVYVNGFEERVSDSEKPELVRRLSDRHFGIGGDGVIFINPAAEADFGICLYNPSSKKRHDHLKKACEILLEAKAADTVCGIVRNIGREGQSSTLCSLEKLKDAQTDMFTTVFIGNSQTKERNGRMVTPRGYRDKEQ